MYKWQRGSCKYVRDFYSTSAHCANDQWFILQDLELLRKPEVAGKEGASACDDRQDLGGCFSFDEGKLDKMTNHIRQDKFRTSHIETM